MTTSGDAPTEPRRSRLRPFLATIGLVVCVVIIAMATMWPTPLDRGFESSITRVLEILHRNGVPTWYGYSKLEFSANIAMFVPLGFLVALLLSDRFWWLALIICPAVSVAIELTQLTLLAARFATVADVIANSAGALVGVICAVLLRYIVHRRDQAVVARTLWQERYGSRIR
jgi:glycopeptide antibiotics resistance protein